MAKTRLALIGNQAFSMQNFRGSLIRDVVARGVEVFAFAPDYDDASANAVRELGAEPRPHQLARTSMNPLRDVAAVASLVRDLRDIKPDVILAYTIKPVIYGTLAGWMAGVPKRFAMIEGLGHVFMDDATPKGRALRFAASSLYKLALGRATHTFFLNADDKREFVSTGLVAEEKADVMGAIGVDLSVWQEAPPVTDPLTFLFIGRLLREKGLIELVEASRRVKAQDPRVRFVILGDVDSNPSGLSRAQVEDWVGEGLLEWPGQVNVGPWIAQSSVFVLPSYREGVPRSTQEAMAMGKPVITTDVPGCRDTVEDGENGFLVEVKNADALADAMLRFVAEPQLIETMGRKSRMLAEQNFDVAKSNARLIAAMGLPAAASRPGVV
ncbi:glycosyltransferase family 4 protein [Hyphomicrobium sp.]|uniref:glycosyltransferase family 4 protein n=1 Tax=Hyphomicrobium sp. TaxID=82 RepID=UPI0025BD7ECC|nr:glycosyltransferase family 4 protein [Hyphomicrobium sp.]MCC7251531.1 glycosyltransferase family 4 protein [Hyphomicrobium sp.]